METINNILTGKTIKAILDEYLFNGEHWEGFETVDGYKYLVMSYHSCGETFTEVCVVNPEGKIVG